jgi:hypothetical protein
MEKFDAKLVFVDQLLVDAKLLKKESIFTEIESMELSFELKFFISF